MDLSELIHEQTLTAKQVSLLTNGMKGEIFPTAQDKLIITDRLDYLTIVDYEDDDYEIPVRKMIPADMWIGHIKMSYKGYTQISLIRGLKYDPPRLDEFFVLVHVINKGFAAL